MTCAHVPLRKYARLCRHILETILPTTKALRARILLGRQLTSASQKHRVTTCRGRLCREAEDRTKCLHKQPKAKATLLAKEMELWRDKHILMRDYRYRYRSEHNTSESPVQTCLIICTRSSGSLNSHDLIFFVQRLQKVPSSLVCCIGMSGSSMKNSWRRDAPVRLYRRQRNARRLA